MIALASALVLAPNIGLCGPDSERSATALLAPNVKLIPGQSATLMPDGRWFLLGGQVDGRAQSKAAVYDPVSKQTTVLDTALSVGRYDHSATLMADGSVLILGGRTGNGETVSIAESFDPAAKRFQPLGALKLLPRSGHRATVLADGRLLVTGGIDAKGRVLDDAELMNPFSSAIEVVNLRTETARFSHLAALLPAHSVLLSGGKSDDRKSVANSEIFEPTQLLFSSYSREAASDALASLTDERAPKLVDSEPVDAAANVGVGQVIAMRFSKRMDVTTLNAETVTLLGVTGIVPVRITPTEGGVVLFVWPAEQLRPANDYSLMIKGAKDTRGQPLDFVAIAFKTGAIGADSAGGSAGTLATANQGGGVGLAINAGKAESTTNETVANAVIGSESEEWTPGIAHYKGAWVSGRKFPHSRDHARHLAERQAFLDTLSPTARAKIHQHWREQNLLPDTNGSIGPASTVMKPAAAVLKAGPGTLGSISGQVLRLDGQPLANVTLSMAGRDAKTDAAGEFLLQNVPLGSQVLSIDGRSANRSGTTYGRFDYHMTVQAGLNDLNFTIWMPKLDTAHAVRIPSPTNGEVVVTNPNLPGLELRIPPGTIIRDVDGKIVDEVSITPIPLDQTPFPMPYVEVPMFFTIQPGGAVIQSVNAKASPGAKLVYPNYTHQPPGARLQLFDYDPKGRGWYIYTLGTVSADGNSLKPDQPFVIYQFTATSAATAGGTPPAEGPPCEGCNCSAIGFGGGPPPTGKGCGGEPPKPGGDCAGDPVACHEGLFLETQTDLSLADILPLSLTRTYRQNDANQRAFGVGASHGLDMYLYFIPAGSPSIEAIDLVRADGGRVHFVSESGGNNYYTTVFQSNAPGVLNKAQINIVPSTISGNEFVLTRKDGVRYGFSYYVSRLKWIEDRNRNRISLLRDGSGRILTAVSTNGRWIDFEYTATTCTSCVTRAVDSAGRSVTYEYDTLGRLTKVTNAELGVTEYGYDTSHRMLTVKDPVGQTTGKYKVQNEYDANGRVKKQTYADNTTTQFAYTLSNGKVVQTDVTHERGDVRRITYDSLGYILTDTRALGKTEQQTIAYTRNASGVGTDFKDGLNRVTHYEYDTLGNVTRMTKLYGTPNAVSWNYTYDAAFPSQIATETDPMLHTVRYSYDSGGRLSQIKDALNHVTDMTYNGFGQLETVTRYKGATPLKTTFGYLDGDLVSITDPLGRMTKFQVDAAGRTVAVTDALNRTTRSEYDNLDRLKAVTDAQGNVVRYDYDANGNLKTFTDAKTNVTKWTYDHRNRPLSKQDALLRTETYQYDLAGNLTFVTDRKGQVTGFEYDFLNRRTKAGFGAANTATPVYQNTTDFFWDGGNRLTKVVDSIAGTITRGYDDRFDALKQEVTPEGTVDYTYYANGLRQTMTPTDGTAVTYSYDSANRLTGISQAAGTGSSVPSTVQGVTIGYDEANRRTSLILPNGIRIAYTWDNASQLTNITYKTSAGALIGDLTYGYDPAGQRTSQGGSLAASDLPAATTVDAIHDADNRLTTWNGTNFSYDNNGSLTGDGARIYGWNSRNQLIAISGATTASFAYDGLGRRRSRTVGGVTTQYLYDGMNAIQEKNGATVTANLLGGLGLDEWYGRTEGGASAVYLPDALGSTLALTNAAQSITTRYTYDPYGKTTATGAASANVLAYTGRENDGTGLYFYRARYYHPGIGRFVSEDPIGLAGGFNPYAYVDGNPISFVDPEGLACWSAGGGPPKPPCKAKCPSGSRNAIKNAARIICLLLCLATGEDPPPSPPQRPASPTSPAPAGPGPSPAPPPPPKPKPTDKVSMGVGIWNWLKDKLDASSVV